MKSQRLKSVHFVSPVRGPAERLEQHYDAGPDCELTRVDGDVHVRIARNGGVTVVVPWSSVMYAWVEEEPAAKK